MLRCSVIGLGKLGAPLAAILAHHFEVIGVDLDPSKIVAINKHLAPVDEPGLAELLQDPVVMQNLTATADITQAVQNSDVTFIILPTPSDAQGFFTNKYLVDAIYAIGPALQAKNKYHLINIVSTVMPGSMAGEIKDALETASGKVVGEELGLTYNPEFIALGNVINGIENPDLILIGEQQLNSYAGDLLQYIYNKICKNNPKLARHYWINAETTKLAINTSLTVKISLANTITQMCGALEGADAAVVTQFMGYDQRIGSKFLSPGMPFGGPCLPRDTIAFRNFCERYNVAAPLIEATWQENQIHIDWILQQIRKNVAADSKIGILGLSYKSGTGVLEESPALKIIAALQDEHRIIAFDNNVNPTDLLKYDLQLKLATSMQECVNDADILVVTLPDPKYKDLLQFAEGNPNFPKVIIDCWGIFKDQKIESSKVVRLGFNGEAKSVKAAKQTDLLSYSRNKLLF